jgi:hypothetical protein
MPHKESPRTPFEKLYSRWLEPPDLFVLDNNCNMLPYVLNREPMHFKRTLFLVDEMHHTNAHKNCSSAFSTAHHHAITNSSLAEQKNALLAAVRNQVGSHMHANIVPLY